MNSNAMEEEDNGLELSDIEESSDETENDDGMMRRELLKRIAGSMSNSANESDDKEEESLRSRKPTKPRTTSTKQAVTRKRSRPEIEEEPECDDGSDKEVSQGNVTATTESSQEDLPQSKKPRKDKKCTSDIWRFATKQKDGTSSCNFCRKPFKATTGNSSIGYHLLFACKQRPQLLLNFDEAEADMLVCRLIVNNGLALRIVEDEDLKKLLSYLRPGYRGPSRYKLVEHLLPQMCKEMNAVIRSKLATMDCYAISIDGWESATSHKYVAVTCHGINRDTWKLESFLLRVGHVTGSETGEFIAELVAEVLRDWGIPMERVVSNTTDGASNMGLGARILERPWVYCTTHAVNRSIDVCLEHSPELSDLLRRTQKLCGKFQFRKAKHALLAEQKALNLPEKTLKLSCPTRWGSLYKMIKRMLMARSAIAVYLLKKKKTALGLKDDDWDKLTSLSEIFQSVNETSQYLSASKTSTVGLIGLLFDHLDKRLSNELTGGDESGLTQALHDPVIADFRNNLLEDLRSRIPILSGEAPVELSLAVYLDPRAKDFSHIRDAKAREAKIAEAKALMADLLRKEESANRSIRRAEKEVTQKKGKPTSGELEAERKLKQKNKYIRIFGNKARMSLSAGRGDLSYKQELELYHQEPACQLFEHDQDDTPVDPLVWWSKHQHKFPRIAKLARRYLCITATSLPCERVFSKGGWLVNKRRCSLSHDRIATLLFLSCNKGHTQQ